MTPKRPSDEETSEELATTDCPLLSSKRSKTETMSPSVSAMSANKRVEIKEQIVSQLRDNGIDYKSCDNQFNCHLCSQTFSGVHEARSHTASAEHQIHWSEEDYEEIDKRFLSELNPIDRTDPKVIVNRRLELKKFSIESQFKEQLIAHGIQLNAGSGSHCYVCNSCQLTFEHSYQMVNHFHEFSKSNSTTKEKPKKRKEREPLEPTLVARLWSECIVVKGKCWTHIFRCRLCDIWITSVTNCGKHIESEEHFESKRYKGVDRLILTPNAFTDQTNHLLLSRKIALKSIAHCFKEEFLCHGIKVSDGCAPNAYLCTQCDIYFKSLTPIKKHLKEFHELVYTLDNHQCWQKEALIEVQALEQSTSTEQIKQLLESEGLVCRETQVNAAKVEQERNEHKYRYMYYCVFCNAKFKTRSEALIHMSRPFHKKVKSGEYQTSTDALFVVNTSLIDEFDVAFARMQVLYRLDSKTKMDFQSKGIRLKNGFGSEAYVCLHCNISIGSETVDSGLAAITEHIDAPEHTWAAIELIVK